MTDKAAAELYLVTYYDVDGLPQSGDFIGAPPEIIARLEAEGHTVTGMKKVRGGGGRARQEDVCTAMVAISDLLRSGVNLSLALEVTCQSLPRSSSLKPVLATMTATVREGKSLATAMSGYPKVFGSTLTSMIEAGEQGDALAGALAGGADYMARVSDGQKQLIKSLSYPLTVLVAALVTLGFNTYFVIPKLMNSSLMQSVMKGQRNISLEILNVFAIVVPVVMVLLVAGGITLFALYRAKDERFELLLMRLPVVRELLFYRGLFVAFFSLSALLGSGSQLAVALQVVRKGATGLVRSEFDRALEKMHDGEHFATGLRFISPVERVMLLTANTAERTRDNVQAVAQRFFRAYFTMVQGLGPKVYTLTMLLAGVIFVLMLFGIVVPYSKMLGGIRA